MHRNLSHRVEFIFPVEPPRLVQRLKEILDVYLSDQAQARYLQSDGSYTRSPNHQAPFALNAQTSFLGFIPEEESGRATGTFM
jgi:polyphosphate kinase